MGNPCPLEVHQIPPLQRAAHECCIYVLIGVRDSFTHIYTQKHTAVDNGKTRSVRRRNFDKNDIAAVLHSSASIANSSRTLNVNAVDGLSEVAG